MKRKMLLSLAVVVMGAAFSGMARLRAENEALRSQILNLQVQWDILKTTLGVLSTTVCTREGT